MGLPFLKSTGKRRDQVVAIDLGARTTKAVNVQRRGDTLHLMNFAFVETPPSEKTLPAEVLAEHFKNVSRALDAGRGRYVTVALGVTETVFRQIELPLMPVADIRLALKYNSKNYLQQELTDHVFDCAYLAPNANGPTQAKPVEAAKASSAAGQKHKVAVGGARRQVVDDLHVAMKEAGMIPDRVVPGIVGPVNAFELAEPQLYGTETVALVEVGFKNSSITVLDCGEIRLHRVLALGGDRLTAGLADIMKISYTEAENIKVGMPQEVQPNLEVMISPLGRELRASIDFFEHQHDRTVSQVFVSGGSTRCDILVQALQTELMVPCKTWLPNRFMQMSLPADKAAEIEHAAPQLGVAIGAAVASF